MRCSSSVSPREISQEEVFGGVVCVKGETLTLEERLGLGASWGTAVGFYPPQYIDIGRRALWCESRQRLAKWWAVEALLFLWLAIGRSWLPLAVDVSDGWGYPRLPLSLRCIFYKGAGTEQTGFHLVSVFSVVTLSIKFPALTMRRRGSGHTDWLGVPTASTWVWSKGLGERVSFLVFPVKPGFVYSRDVIRVALACVPKPLALEHLLWSVNHDLNIFGCRSSEEQGVEHTVDIWVRESYLNFL